MMAEPAVSEVDSIIKQTLENFETITHRFSWFRMIDAYFKQDYAHFKQDYRIRNNILKDGESELKRYLAGSAFPLHALLFTKSDNRVLSDELVKKLTPRTYNGFFEQFDGLKWFMDRPYGSIDPSLLELLRLAKFAKLDPAAVFCRWEDGDTGRVIIDTWDPMDTCASITDMDALEDLLGPLAVWPEADAAIKYHRERLSGV